MDCSLFNPNIYTCFGTAAALELLKDISEDIMQIGPMLRKSIKKEAGFDIDKIEKKINEILRHEIEYDKLQ